MSTHVTGHCYCGDVTFDVTIPDDDSPIFTAYCHCDSCRRAHAAPLYQVVCVDKTQFTLTSGAELVRSYRRPGASIERRFCGQCGSRVYNDHLAWKPNGKTPLTFFPALLQNPGDLPSSLRPAKNANAGECMLDAERLAEVLPCGS